MRSTILSLAFLFTSAVYASAQSKLDAWPELKTYATALSETFLPSEKGDLKPVKTRSHELAVLAKKITATTVPQEYDNEKVKNVLSRLIKESDKLNAFVVRQEQDMTIVKQLNKVEDTYNELTSLCNKKEASNP